MNISKRVYSYKLFRSINRAFCRFEILQAKHVKIGNFSKRISTPKNPELVPIKFLDEKCTQTILGHLQWIMKKDSLGQDMFLIGAPGPTRRRIIMQYAELTQREIEYIVLSRDTTESDLKQRREIVSGTAFYKDQSAVKAAIEGRILILDGVEKAERNVLPILNNLLENREIQLEDGRFLVSPERYDKLLLENSQEILDSWKLVRVSEQFRVIALGLPIPQYRGHPLDPPFRSRFQARNVLPDYQAEIKNIEAPNFHWNNEIKTLLSFCQTFSMDEIAPLSIPNFPIESLQYIIPISNSIINIPVPLLFQWMYPYHLFLNSDAKKYVEKNLRDLCGGTHESIALRKFNIHLQDSNKIILQFGNTSSEILIPNSLIGPHVEVKNFVENDYHESVLTDMLAMNYGNDFCVIGSKGSGKTMLVKKLASLIKVPYEMVMLYKDMTARDLLQQRITDHQGNTHWRPSPLINAAINGGMVVLDGLHHLHQSTLSVLQRLIQDRDIQLFDGTRILQPSRYDAIKEKYGFTNEMMDERHIHRLHPTFRIIALAEPPTSKNQWLTPEVLSMFLFNPIKTLSLTEEKHLIEQLVGPLSEKMDVVLNFAHSLRNSTDEALSSIGGSLSTRQLIRTAHRLSVFPHQDIYVLINQTCLTKFLPRLTRQAFIKALEASGIISNQLLNDSSSKICETKDKYIFIGKTSAPIYEAGISKVKVPDILFYDNPEHIAIMEDMLQEFVLGEHLLLIGNQGVGKNKIVDRFLQLLNRPREYIQLHRDTTVQSLTQQPSVVHGRIIYEDSPLIKAVQHGHVLVVDEADKAPTHVTCILKALVESGQMILSDGRSIVHADDPKSKSCSKEIITMHPDFRMIVLANRPGFPFLGNDFFATLGDIFSCHCVENPTLKSEISMLHQYGPNVPISIINRLVKLFGELRSMSDGGLIAYPYSTREVVNVVKHLEMFSDEGLPLVLRNVFDFDTYNKELKETLLPIFKKHGVPFGSATASIKLAKTFDLPEPTLGYQWTVGKEDILNSFSQQLKISTSYMLPIKMVPLDTTEARADVFTEQNKYWQLPIGEDNIPLSMSIKHSEESDTIYIATANPISISSLDTFNNILRTIDLSNLFPSIRRGFRPKLNIAALSGLLKDSVVLFEKSTNQVFILDMISGNVTEISLSSVFSLAKEKLSKMLNRDSNQKQLNMHTALADKNILLFTNPENTLSVVDLNKYKIYNFEVPDFVQSVSSLTDKMLFVEGKNSNFLIDISNVSQWKIQILESLSMGHEEAIIFNGAAKCENNSLIHKSLKSNESDFLTVLSHPSHFGSFSLGEPLTNQKLNLYCIPRRSKNFDIDSSVILSNGSQIVRLMHPDVAKKEFKRDLDFPENCMCMEVSDFHSLQVSHIPVPLPSELSTFAQWLSEKPHSYLLMHPCRDSGVVTVDASGCVRSWETEGTTIQKSLDEWFKVTGTLTEQQLTIEKDGAPDVSAPKHGKVDPTGAPHVGGNTWAGGTGGRDTAGLGGKGGPYRLDAGHNVFQLPDAEKDAVPPEVKKAAREMALKVYKEKLKEIEMSEYDAEMYEGIYNNVKSQVGILRTILESLQAKTKERQWLKHQTSGELDDTKLVEGITGEKNIYRKRGEEEPELGSPQEKPKKLRILVDVSGSMYRFNGHDNRLVRELESVTLVMEAFDGHKDKFLYDIVGHSGEEFAISFSQFQNPPKNNKDRLEVLKKMYVHSQFCMSGDNTLRATKHAIENIAKEEADEHFVIIMSDANFDRYGISPKAFSSLLLEDSQVNSFAVFIGTLGDQADRLHRQLPPGRGFICMDTTQLPHILQQIFTSALFKES